MLMNVFRVDCWQRLLLYRFDLIPFELIYAPDAHNISQTNPCLPFHHSDNFFSPQMRLKLLPALQLQTLGASANRGHSVSQIRPAKSVNVVPSKSLPEIVCYTTHQPYKQTQPLMSGNSAKHRITLCDVKLHVMLTFFLYPLPTLKKISLLGSSWEKLFLFLTTTFSLTFLVKFNIKIIK